MLNIVISLARKILGFLVMTDAKSIATIDEGTRDDSRVICDIRGADGDMRHVVVGYRDGIDLDRIYYITNYVKTGEKFRGHDVVTFERDRTTPLSPEDRAALAIVWKIDDTSPSREGVQTGHPAPLKPIEHKL